VIFAGDEEDDDDVAAMGPDNFVRGLVAGATSCDSASMTVAGLVASLGHLDAQVAVGEPPCSPR
jgi:hypothetical protein